MRKRSMRWMAVLMAAAMTLSGCSSGKSNQTTEAVKETSVAATEKAADQTTAGAASTKDSGEKVLRIGTYMPMTTLVPWKTTSDGDGYVLRQVYHTLVEMNKKSEFTPGLATSWECSPDGKVWTVKIRDDVYWQTGNDLFGDEKVQVTAEDVKFSYEYQMDPANESVRYTSLSDSIDKIEVVDDFTLKFYTKDIDVLFEYKMYQNYIFPQKGIEENWDFNAFPVGSGAYKFVEHVIDTRVVLEKNEDFWQEPGLDKVEYRIITDKSVGAIALQNKEIDIAIALLPTEVGAVKEKDYLKLDHTNGALRWVGFNCQDELFKDPELRRALSMAVDMDSAVQAIFGNDAGVELAIRGYSCVTPERPGYDGEACKAVAPVYDPKGAQAKLEELGWSKGSDGIYAKDGQKLSFVLQVGNNDTNREKLAVIVSSQLKAIGVDCTAKTVEWGTHLSDMDAGNVRMYVAGGYSNLDGPLKIMMTDEKVMSPNCGYSNEEVDALLEQAWKTVDFEDRSKLISDAAVLFAKDCAHLGGYYEYTQTGYNTRVKDFDYVSVYHALCNSQRNVTVE